MKNRDSEPATKVDDNTERAYRWLSERLTPFDEEIRDLRRLLDEAEARGAAAEREACIAEAAEPLVEADTARDAQRVIVGRLVVGKRRGNHSPEASWDPSSSSSPQPSGSSPGVSSSPSSTPMTDRPDNDPPEEGKSR